MERLVHSLVEVRRRSRTRFTCEQLPNPASTVRYAILRLRPTRFVLITRSVFDQQTRLVDVCNPHILFSKRAPAPALFETDGVSPEKLASRRLSTSAGHFEQQRSVLLSAAPKQPNL